jgi:hypothetical protein
MTDTDKKLLELAAKAAGIAIKFEYTHGVKDLDVPPRRTDTWENWNPFNDDGDALRLAVKLGLRIDPLLGATLVYGLDCSYRVMDKDCQNDEYAATRLAIVRAAAEIGRSMK